MLVHRRKIYSQVNFPGANRTAFSGIFGKGDNFTIGAFHSTKNTENFETWQMVTKISRKSGNCWISENRTYSTENCGRKNKSERKFPVKISKNFGLPHKVGLFGGIPICCKQEFLVRWKAPSNSRKFLIRNFCFVWSTTRNFRNFWLMHGSHFGNSTMLGFFGIFPGNSVPFASLWNVPVSVFVEHKALYVCWVFVNARMDFLREESSFSRSNTKTSLQFKYVNWDLWLRPQSWQNLQDAATQMVVSSAYIWISPSPPLAISGRSLQHKDNRVGPNTEPCGTPNLTGITSDLSLFTFVTWVRSVK